MSSKYVFSLHAFTPQHWIYPVYKVLLVVITILAEGNGERSSRITAKVWFCENRCVKLYTFALLHKL